MSGAEAAPVRANRPLRLAIVTNIPTPYRIPVYDLLADRTDLDVLVVYFAEREFDRDWVLDAPRAETVVLPSTTVHRTGRDIHFSRGGWAALSRFRPDVVLTTGFNPAHLVAFAWAVAHGVPHVAQTDGTPDLERRLSRAHRIARRVVSRRSGATVAASRAGLDLLLQWGATPGTRFVSALAVDNAAFAADGDEPRDVDVLWSGRLNDRKDPLLALRVARAAAMRLERRLTVVLLGDGPLADHVRAFGADAAAELDVRVAGFQQQDALPGWYRRSRVFLFPSHEDAWGLVVNEAAAAGVPQLVSTAAGARELVDEGVSGFVLDDADEAAWTAALVTLLSDEPMRAAMGARAVQRAAPFTWAAAADGIAAAAFAAARGRRGSRRRQPRSTRS